MTEITLQDNQAGNEKVQSLLEYCNKNGRVCPQPQKWDELWKMLPDKKQKGSKWYPPLPLILGAWWHTNTKEKRERFKLHLSYAEEKGILDIIDVFLRELADEHWFTENEQIAGGK